VRKPERPVTLDGVEEAKLPGSGTIKLSEVKSEFAKGNSLTDYYGVVSGIPNSGTIKLTDFYGKEQPSPGYAPFGNYSGTYTRESWRDSANNVTRWMDTVRGTGDGDPISFPNSAGLAGAHIYGDVDDAFWAVMIRPSSQSDVNFFNQYNALVIQPISAPASTFRGGYWELRYFDGAPYAAYVSSAAGSFLRPVLDANKGFYLGVAF
jgi:hypothetical protein